MDSVLFEKDGTALFEQERERGRDVRRGGRHGRSDVAKLYSILTMSEPLVHMTRTIREAVGGKPGDGSPQGTSKTLTHLFLGFKDDLRKSIVRSMPQRNRTPSFIRTAALLSSAKSLFQLLVPVHSFSHFNRLEAIRKRGR